MRKFIWVSFLVLLLAGGEAVLAQGGVQWQRYDVNITIQQNSGITMEEIHEVSLVQGETTFQRVIPADRVESIENVQVLELNPGGGQRAYQQADSQAEHTFQVFPSDADYTIQLYFPPNNVASTRFVIRYFVVGGLRFYDEGDVFDWRPFGWSAPGPVGSSSTTIKLPAAIPQNQMVQSSSGAAAEQFAPEPGRAIFRATNVASGDGLDVSLTFPHGVVQGSPPSWQRVADATPVLQAGSIIVAILLLLAGLGGVYAWWYFKLRIPPDSAKVPKYINKPPSPLTPAAAGALLDGKAAPRHMMATMLDLAARGALHVYPASNKEANKDNDNKHDVQFDLYGVNQEKAIEPYEATLYGKIFGYMGARKRKLADVRRTVYMSVPELKNQIDVEIAKAGYFAEDTQAVRRQYLAFGGAAILVSIVLALLAAVLFSGLTVLVACPFLSIVIIAIAFIMSGYAKSNRTEKGEKAAVRWEAFRRYLKDITPKQAAKARPVFGRLLPYAVGFGVEKELVKSFAAANTATPKWWSIPEEKLPDVGHEDAHAWVSETVVSQPAPTARPEKTRTKSVVRRLGTPAEASNADAALKNIQPVFMNFLKAGLEMFAKAPPLEDEEDEDLLEDV